MNKITDRLLNQNCLPENDSVEHFVTFLLLLIELFQKLK